MAYCTVADVQARIRSAFDDRDLENAIEAATTRIEKETGRVFAASASESRTFEAVRDYFCAIDDLLTVSAVVWEDAEVDADSYSFKPGGSRTPKYAIVNGPWLEGDEVTITGTWGYAESCPADIRDACVEWVVRAIKRADQGYRDASAIPELGELVYSKAVPAEVRRVLDRYTRWVPS
jgi:hypothetical protein